MLITEQASSVKWVLMLLWISAQNTRDVQAVCSKLIFLGGDYGTNQGNLQSPGYPSTTYPNKIRCTWIIKVPEDHRVELHFKRIDVERCSKKQSNCSCDAVEVHDGELLIDKLLARLCGTETPPPITSSGRFMRVDLVSNEDTGGAGFYAGFNSVSPDGATPTSFYTNDGKAPRTKPTGSKSSGGNASVVMIAVVCSLVGIAVIGLLALWYLKRKQKARIARPRVTEMSLSTAQQHAAAHVPNEPPPPYQSVISANPPPYLAAYLASNQSPS